MIGKHTLRLLDGAPASDPVRAIKDAMRGMG